MRVAIAVLALLTATVTATIVPGRNDVEARDLAADADFYRIGTPVKRVSIAFPSNAVGGTLRIAAACKDSSSCASGYCNHGACDTSKATGHVCYKNQGCASGSCVNKQCVPAAGTGVKGATCNLSSQCQTGYSCQTSKCQANKKDGAYCFKDNMCESTTCYKNKCVKLNSVKMGQSCKKSTSCKSGFCKNGACAAQKATGGRCTKNQGCVSGTCALAKDHKLRCT